MVSDVSVSGIQRETEIDAVLRLDGLDAEQGDQQPRLTSNTDRKVTVYSTIDGEPRPIAAIDAKRVLSKVRADGKPAFWMPGMTGSAPEYVRGTVKCMLHPDFDETDGAAGFARDYIDRIGLANRTCNMNARDKNNRGDFKSAFDRDDHMQKKHRREWATIQAAIARDRERREAEERRADREAMMALVRGAASTVAAPVAPETVPCDVDGCTYVGSTGNVNRHKAAAHRE